jgi:TonB family protein
MHKLFLINLVALCAVFTVSAQNSSAPIAAKPLAPKIVSKGVINGSAISLPKPIYPEAIRAEGTGGQVNVQVTIDEQGNVISAVAQSGPDLLKVAATEAALQAKFTPTLLAGQPVKVSGIIVYNFQARSYEEQIMMMGAGMVINMPGTFDPESEDKVNPEELLETFPGLGKELEPLNTLAELTPEKRKTVIDSVSAAIKKSLSGSDAWQFAAGENLGNISAEFMRMAEDENFVPDGAKIKKNLTALKASLSNAPAEFPVPVLNKLKSLAELADMDNFRTMSDKMLLGSRVMAVIETISPGAAKDK